MEIDKGTQGLLAALGKVVAIWTLNKPLITYIVARQKITRKRRKPAQKSGSLFLKVAKKRFESTSNRCAAGIGCYGQQASLLLAHG